MSLFIEVFSVPKGVNVIINLDEVVEIAPLPDGSAALFFKDGGSGSGSMTSINVKQAVPVDNLGEDEIYSTFKQFVVQTVSSDDISKRIASLSRAAGEKQPFPNLLLEEDSEEPEQPPRNKGGRPRKNP